jgi:hypothetical protein
VRKWLTGIVVTLALIAVALLLRQREQLPPTPAAAVSAFFEAARTGDVDAYVRLTGGDLRRGLEQTRTELGGEGFRDYVRRFADGIKGLAGRSGDGEGVEADTATLDIEIVFADRNERQRVTLVRQRTGWIITSLEKAALSKPAVPYGTPVFESPLPKDKPSAD